MGTYSSEAAARGKDIVSTSQTLIDAVRRLTDIQQGASAERVAPAEGLTKEQATKALDALVERGKLEVSDRPFEGGTSTRIYHVVENR
jgi:hypothetical protein